jgi:hypothetical protein
VLKNFFYHTRLVSETDGARFEFPQGGELVDPHLSLAFGTNLHGGGGHAETCVRNLIPLAQKFRVLAIDCLGHSYTDKPKITYGLNAFSKHLLDFMDAAGVEKAHLVGSQPDRSWRERTGLPARTSSVNWRAASKSATPTGP